MYKRQNIRYVVPEDIPDPIEFSSIDVSFISLTKVLGPVQRLLTADGQIVALIKPQFEAGREKVGKKGVVREKSTHLEVIEKVITHAQDLGFVIRNLDYSPIKGPEGNIEYLVHLEKHGPETLNQEPEEQTGGEVLMPEESRKLSVEPQTVVEEAHKKLQAAGTKGL